MKGDIVFGADIIKNVAKELGISEKKVKHVFDFLFLHIRKETRKPDTYSVKLPKVGRLYMMTELYKKTLIDRDKKDTVSKKARVNHKKEIEKLENFEKMFQEESKGKFLRTIHKKGANIRNFFFNKGKTLEELEIIQNG